MLISRKKRFIFVHIKKTAGSSITKSLSKFDDRNLLLKLLNTNTLTRIKFIKRVNPLSHHVTASQIRAYLGSDYDDYFSFAFVRNPFDWQVSNYFYIRQHRLHPRYREVKTLSFYDYLKWTRDEDRIRLQCDSITDKDKPDNVLVNYVGKFETIQHDFNHILTKIGLADEITLEHANKSIRSKNYRQYYDNESIDFINTHYEQDLRLFDYEF